MHIALNGWFWDQPNTGSGQYLRQLLRALRRADPGAQFTLVLPPHITEADDLPPDISLVPTAGPGGNWGKLWFEQRLFPRAAAQVGANIAHVPYWGPPLAAPAPLAVSVLDVIPLALPDYARGVRARLYTSLVSAAARGAAEIITLSYAAQHDIEEHLGIAAARITPIYLAPDERYHPRLGAERDADVRAKYNLPDRFVLYLGGFDVRKQVNQLLLAHTYVRQADDDVPLVIAGRAPQWGAPLFPDLPAYAAELGIADAVQWLGYVDEADKPALYRLASVFAYPSRYEGFGLPVIEAMACGTPVVANEVSSLPEVVGDGAFLVEPGSARAMAGAIIALLLQDALRQTQINAGLAQATRYSWRRAAEQTLAVYRRALKA